MSASLEELAHEPALARTLTAGERQALLLRIAGLLLVLSTTPPAPEIASGGGHDELLSVEQAAALLGVPREFIWRKSRRADWRPFTVRVSRKVLRLKRRGLEQWLATRGAAR